LQYFLLQGFRLHSKATNTNILEDEHIKKILKVFNSKEDIKHFAKSVDVNEIKENDYNLSVSNYVEPEDTREKIDIKVLNQELKESVVKIDKLRSEIDKIVQSIEGV